MKTINMIFIKLNQYEKYRDLSMLSVILYNECKQRHHKSKYNKRRKFEDEKGIYFHSRKEELAYDLNVSPTTLTKDINELIEIGLLEIEVRRGKSTKFYVKEMDDFTIHKNPIREAFYQEAMKRNHEKQMLENHLRLQELESN